MALEQDPNLNEQAEAVIRQCVRNLMANIRNSCRQIRGQIATRRENLISRFGEEDWETLVEMYEKLQEVVDLVNGDPPPDFPEE